MGKSINRIWLSAATIGVVLAACTSPRTKYEMQKEEAQDTLDSLLEVARAELAATDCLLIAAQHEFDLLDTTMHKHEDYEQALNQLTGLRLRRDSLKIRWETLGAQIRYINRKNQEIEEGRGDNATGGK